MRGRNEKGVGAERRYVRGTERKRSKEGRRGGDGKTYEERQRKGERRGEGGPGGREDV